MLREVVARNFSPKVAVVASPDAQEVCRKNNLSFVELLRPFERLDTKGS
jgi:hypothetical protein